MCIAVHVTYFENSGKTVESLDNYLKAFRNSPTQPLVALCVATTLLSLASSHPKVKQRREVCAKVMFKYFLVTFSDFDLIDGLFM